MTCSEPVRHSNLGHAAYFFFRVVLAFLFGAGDGGGDGTDLRVRPLFDLTFDC